MVPLDDVDHRAACAYRVFRGWPTEEDVNLLGMLGHEDHETDGFDRATEKRMAEDPEYRVDVEEDRAFAAEQRHFRIEEARYRSLVLGEPYGCQ